MSTASTTSSSFQPKIQEEQLRAGGAGGTPPGLGQRFWPPAVFPACCKPAGSALCTPTPQHRGPVGPRTCTTALLPSAQREAKSGARPSEHAEGSGSRGVGRTYGPCAAERTRGVPAVLARSAGWNRRKVLRPVNVEQQQQTEGTEIRRIWHQLTSHSCCLWRDRARPAATGTKHPPRAETSPVTPPQTPAFLLKSQLSTEDGRIKIQRGVVGVTC